MIPQWFSTALFFILIHKVGYNPEQKWLATPFFFSFAKVTIWKLFFCSYNISKDFFFIHENHNLKIVLSTPRLWHILPAEVGNAWAISSLKNRWHALFDLGSVCSSRTRCSSDWWQLLLIYFKKIITKDTRNTNELFVRWKLLQFFLCWTYN